MENWMVSIVAAAVGATLKPIGEYIVGILKYHFGEMRVRRLKVVGKPAKLVVSGLVISACL
jgi:hypothetical protein